MPPAQVAVLYIVEIAVMLHDELRYLGVTRYWDKG